MDLTPLVCVIRRKGWVRVSQAELSKKEVCGYTVTGVLAEQGAFRGFQVVCKVVRVAKGRWISPLLFTRQVTMDKDSHPLHFHKDGG